MLQVRFTIANLWNSIYVVATDTAVEKEPRTRKMAIETSFR